MYAFVFVLFSISFFFGAEAIKLILSHNFVWKYTDAHTHTHAVIEILMNWSEWIRKWIKFYRNSWNVPLALMAANRQLEPFLLLFSLRSSEHIHVCALCRSNFVLFSTVYVYTSDEWRAVVRTEESSSLLLSEHTNQLRFSENMSIGRNVRLKRRQNTCIGWTRWSAWHIKTKMRQGDEDERERAQSEWNTIERDY